MWRDKRSNYHHNTNYWSRKELLTPTSYICDKPSLPYSVFPLWSFVTCIKTIESATLFIVAFVLRILSYENWAQLAAALIGYKHFF